MANPFRSEAEAYRFLLITIGYFAAIVIATLVGGQWVGFIVFVALTLVGVWWLFRRRPEAPLRTAPPRRGAENERRILVIANETVGGETLREEIRRRSEGYEEDVHVVCPALNSPIRHWASDEDRARANA